jgi:hypothetical protein
MYHRTLGILARPSLPEYQGMTDHLQERARGQDRAQDVCRELCECVPCCINPGFGLKAPENLKINNLVLIRRDIVATNKINSILKLTRMYSTKAYRVTHVSGNHVSVCVKGGSYVYPTIAKRNPTRIV